VDFDKLIIMDGKLLVALLLISLLVKSFAKPSSDKLRFIKTGQDEEGHWVNEETILDLVRNHIGFSDITNLNVPNKMPPRPDLIGKFKYFNKFKFHPPMPYLRRSKHGVFV